MKTALGAAPSLATTASVGFVCALWRPLWLRLKLGEGALLAVNLGLLVAAPPPAGAFAWRASVSLAALALMYALNDYWDAAADRYNPRKSRHLAEFLLEERRRFGALLVVTHGALVAIAAVGGGASLALSTLLALGFNALYSVFLKGMPIADVVVVGAWGAAYAAIAGQPAALLVVGSMTAVSHVFQTVGDLEADRRAHVFTSASRPVTTHILLLVASLHMVAGFWPQLGGLAVLALFPTVAALTVRSSYRAWLVSKLLFGALFLAFLVRIDVGL